MRRAPRTSPTKAVGALTDAQSEPDLSSMTASDTDLTNITARKRMRADDLCPDNQFEQLKLMLETWKSDQEAILNKLVCDVGELKAQNQQIKASNIEIEKSINFINKDYEEMRNKIKVLENERQDFLMTITRLDKKIQDMQLCSRTSSIELRNVPVREKESVADLTNLITKVGTTVQLAISPKDIRDVYRLPGKTNTNKTIVAELSTVYMKNNLLTATRNFNKTRTKENKLNTESLGLHGVRQPIYVSEYMAPSARKTFLMAREYAKTHKYTFCWYSNGKVFLRKEQGSKHVLVESELCLNKLKMLETLEQ